MLGCVVVESRTRSGCEGESGFWSATEVRVGGRQLSCKCCTIRREGTSGCWIASLSLFSAVSSGKSPRNADRKCHAWKGFCTKTSLQSTVAGTRKSQDGLLSALSRSWERGNSREAALSKSVAGGSLQWSFVRDSHAAVGCPSGASGN